ncbi:hypothetical protein C1X05_14905 [Laceyella sacchari]|jgi:hypothetical protein|nr:hypothetical protein C1X05_14905 [Laceyella sacchari]
MKNKDWYIFDIFHSNNWKQASTGEREKNLQLVEDYYSKIQNRKPECLVLFQNLKEDIMGGYSKNVIRLNKDYIQDHPQTLDKKDPLRKYLNYACLDTIIHEGRHAYQDYACNNSNLHPDQKTVEKWKRNSPQFGTYITNDKGIYRFQARERDSHEYAFSQLKNIYEYLKNKFGEDKTFDMYLFYEEQKNKDYEILAQSAFGDNYIEEIDNLIDKMYKEKIRELEWQEPSLHLPKNLVNLDSLGDKSQISLINMHRLTQEDLHRITCKFAIISIKGQPYLGIHQDHRQMVTHLLNNKEKHQKHKPTTRTEEFER